MEIKKHGIFMWHVPVRYFTFRLKTREVFRPDFYSCRYAFCVSSVSAIFSLRFYQECNFRERNKRFYGQTTLVSKRGQNIGRDSILRFLHCV